ncbi:ATP-dependent RNA helicase DDX51 [Lampetra fluviatilis]
MALFPVKRFLGDDEEADVGHGEGSDGRARLILQRLNEGGGCWRWWCGRAPPRHGAADPRPKRKRKGDAEGDGRVGAGRHGDDAPEAVAVAETTVAMAATKPVAVAAAATKPVAMAKTAVAVAKKATKPVAVATKPVAVAKKAAAGSTFTVLADVGKKTAKAKVERVLPDWLARPRVVSRSIRHRSVPTSDLPWLHPRLYSKMAANGIHSLFPVQVQVIPAVLEGAAAGGFILGRGGQRPSDICVSAPTGSGKTLAFVIPIVQLLMDRAVCQIRALVVLPTKELAQQVWREFRAYADSEGLRVVLACGAQRFGEEQQSLVETTPEGLVVSRADVVVATAGRLVDHLARTPGVSLAHLRFLEYYVPVSLKLKPLAVLHFALHLRFRKILCFTNTRQAAHRLYHLVRLYGGVEVAEFSSMMSPAMRRKTLKRFQGGDLQLLVSSDAAARGIDVRSVTCVLSYDCPDFIHNYVHRVGRTARAGAVGLAYTLVTSSQVPGFVKMRVGAGRSSLHCHTLGASRLQQLVPRLRTALTELKQLLKEEAETRRTL